MMSYKNYFENTPGLLNDCEPRRLHQLIGEIMQIWLAVKTHRNSSLLEFERSVFLPIHHNQFRIYKRNGKPIGFVSWAYLTAELGEQYIKGKFDFKPEYWNIGEELWFIDFITPFGDARAVVSDLRNNVFPNEIAYAPLFDKKGNKYKKIKLHGVNRRAGNKRASEDDALITKLLLQ